MPNLHFNVPPNVRSEVYGADIDFENDTFTMLLMRAGFGFKPTVHTQLKNIITNTGAVSQTCDATAMTITRASGSYITDGFVVNNYITTNGANNGWYKVTSVSALSMSVADVSGTAFSTVGATSITTSSDDEYAYASSPSGGYTQGGVTVTFTIDSAHRLLLDTFDMSSLGTTAPALSPGVIIYDETEANDTIIAFGKFSDWLLRV